MKKAPVFIYENTYLVFNGEIEIGAVVAGRLYRYDIKDSPFQTYDIVGGRIIQHCQIIGRIEGLTITIEKTKETLELVAT